MKKEELIHRELEGNLLTFREVKRGIQEVILDVGKLYSNQKKKMRFEERMSQFLDSHPLCPIIFSRKDELLIYRTECVIPEKLDSRIPLLILLGNPAFHSVHSEMFFSFESNGREHRFWKVLKKAGLLSFTSNQNSSSIDMADRNLLRKKELFELAYNSPFRIGLTVFFSMSSGASDTKWAGVAGLKNLFGTKALRRIKASEKARVERIIRKFLSPSKGVVFAFQKDAYLGIKSLTTPDYDKDKVNEGKLVGVCQCDPNIRLFCLPPTRHMYGKNMLDLLYSFKERILRKKNEVQLD